MASKSNSVYISFYQNVRPGYTDKTETTILAEVHYTVNGNRPKIRFSTGMKCAIGKFDKDKRVDHRAKHAYKINQRLDIIRANAETAYLQSIRKGTFPTKEKFKEMILRGVFELEEERDMLSDLNNYLEFLQNKGSHRGTISHVVNLKRHLLEFKHRTKYSLNYDTINMEFYGKFSKYLNESPEQYKVNSIGNFIKKLRMFLNWTKSNGWNPYNFYKRREFQVPEMQVQNIYLQEDEVDILLNLNLKGRPELSLTRDWFVLATQTGMRYSDYSQFVRSNIKEDSGNYNFEYTPRKTQKQTKGASAHVPLSGIAIQIAVRHGFEIPMPASNQKVNAGLKTLMSLAGIKKNVSSHDARRTFATLSYKRGTLTTREIMSMTGHRTEREFLKYICVTAEENAKRIREKDSRFQVNRPGLLDSKLKIV